MSLEGSTSIHDQMKEAVKEKALEILKMDDKVERLSKAIDNGDTNLFFIEMVGKKTMFTSKLITSLQTSFGMVFYEQMCIKMGELVGYEVQRQYKLIGYEPPELTDYLQFILEDMKYVPNRRNEYQYLSEIYEDIKDNVGESVEIPDSTVDVFIKKPDGTEIFIDITTVKPNKKEFRTMKKKILRWYFARLVRGDIDPSKIETYIALPYNPYSRTSNTYTHMGKYYDRKDLLVGDELWKLVSNDQFSLEDMIDVFKEIGVESKDSIEKSLNTDHL